MSETIDGADSPLQYAMVSLLNSKLCLGPLPALDELNTLSARGVTHLVTFQTEEEIAPTLRSAMQTAALNWLWMPYQVHSPLTETEQGFLQQYLVSFKKIVTQSSQLYLHCDSSCKRSLLFVLAFCHYLGLTSGDSYRLLHYLDRKRTYQLTSSEQRWAQQLGESVKLSR
ncbi:hypothetical protein [Alteromonas ponticola]|uniref:Tyrosine specific protein phosphatases domain-containing protein n=1 Tax=Alteromonas ponticola TaxID=2720613 RepID=A0ABX1R414_9ALTE|nr:hypothetical protein [Alteromonas ponticola]NMH60518.1 hypothetical protein [Alteromonas ponticola]